MAWPRLRADGGGIVMGWLIKLTFILLAFGVIAYDVVSISFAKVAAADDARYIALGASEAMVLERADDAAAIEMAGERADARGVMLGKKDIVIDEDGSVTVRVDRTATTLVAYHIGPLDDLTHIHETYVTASLR